MRFQDNYHRGELIEEAVDTGLGELEPEQERVPYMGDRLAAQSREALHVVGGASI